MKTIAEDKFQNYYTEKIWELIPPIYRHEDGLDSNSNPHVLRALVEVMAEQAAILRRSQDRLWEDQFIDLCNDWAVPYIGDLLGTRLLSALNERGRRVDVAKTIYYRRRKGTLRILEELINDISSWDGKLVESFQHLVRTRHGLDSQPHLLAGRYTNSLPGGTPDLRAAIASELIDGPFEEYYHTPDFRKPKGFNGRYGITKLNFHLYRLFAYKVITSTPFEVAADQYLFDPSGRSIPLFSKRNRMIQSDWDDWHSADEWELPAPIRCRLLGHAEYEIKEEQIQRLVHDGLSPAIAVHLLPLMRHRFRNEAELKTHTGFLSAGFFLLLLRYAIIKKCGKEQLIPGSISIQTGLPAETISKENITAGNLQNWSASVAGKDLVIDAEQGRLLLLAPPASFEDLSVTYHYGFSGPFGAGTYDRRAVEDSEPTIEIMPATATIDFALLNPTEIVQIIDNKTYTIISDPPPLHAWVVQAANQQRPYLILSTGDLIFTSATDNATLVLDGLWIGALGDQVFNIILQGNYECVVIRNCTLDPGGGMNGRGETLHPVTLIIEGVIEELCIEKSITGPIRTTATALIEKNVTIVDSIIQSVTAADDALFIHSGITDIRRTTIYGTVKLHRLYASDTIITGRTTVTDTQTGCFRFSAAPAVSRLPRPYESFLFESDNNHWFGSREFGQPAYAQLTETTPVDLYRGGENGAEMGVFNSLLNAIKRDGLQDKIGEYMPFGLIPAFINET